MHKGRCPFSFNALDPQLRVLRIHDGAFGVSVPQLVAAGSSLNLGLYNEVFIKGYYRTLEEVTL